MRNKSHYCAEVTESSLCSIKAECWPDRPIPPYGSLVVIDKGENVFYGVVYAIYAHADEAFRSVNAYQKTEEELRAEQPQIFAFLKTSFQALIVGVEEGGRVSHMYAPEPASLHSFVRSADTDEYVRFFKSAYYVSLIFDQAHLIGSVDELFLHMLSSMKSNKVSEVIYEEFIDQYSLLNGNDYRRMKSFLCRMQQRL